MLSSLLPGLRQLRGPLAAGYLWLLLFWLAFGDELPTSDESKAGALDRAYRLEPVLSQLGLAVVGSVAAYVIGSIVIDMQVRIAQLATATPQPPGSRGPADLSFLRREKRRLILMPILAGVGWFAVAVWLLPDSTAAKIVAGVVAIAYCWFNLYWTSNVREFGPTWINIFRNRFTLTPKPVVVTRQGWGELVRWLADVAGDVPTGGYAAQPALDYVIDNRNLLKTRLLVDSEALHAQVDRLDAEATFRQAIWPPLAVLAIYLAVAVNPLWLFGLVVPIVLAWQWISLRKQANDALVTVLAARPTLNEPVTHHVREKVAREVALDKVDRDGNVVSLDLDVEGKPFRHEALIEKEDGTQVAVRLDGRFNVVG